MSPTVGPRLAPSIPIANVAFPSILIILVLLVGVLLTGGILFVAAYLFYRRTSGTGDGTDR